jgi:8-oxo-dGTP pyrophosphatase MutT (NUDIX family)
MEIQRSRSAGGIVIGDTGTIAMVRHRNSNGAWLFPKGHPELGESDEDAARREIAEECGVDDVELIDDLGTYERHPILPDGTEDRGEMKEIHMFLFAAKPGSTITAQNEMDGARWVPLQRVVEECGNIHDRAWFVKIFERVRAAIQRD